MKDVLLFSAVILIISAAIVRAEINLDSGPYSDDFNSVSSNWQTDAYAFDFANVYIPVTEEDTAEGGNLNCLTLSQVIGGDRPYIDYGFTRSDASKPGAVTFDAIDYASGECSWIMFYYDCDYGASLDEQFSGSDYGTAENIANLSGGNPSTGHVSCRLAIPAGAKRMYIRFCTPSYAANLGTNFKVGIDNLYASADGSELDAKNTIVLTKENPTYSDDYNDAQIVVAPHHTIAPVRWQKESYAVTGSILHSYGIADNANYQCIRFYDKDSSITYKFSVPGGTNQIVVNFDAKEFASGDNSWMGPQVLDAGGNVVYSNNITNLAGTGGGAGSFTFDFSNVTKSFYVKFAGTWGTDNAINEGLAPFISKLYGCLYSFSVTANNVGSLIDANADDLVDMEDFSGLADNWLQSK